MMNIFDIPFFSYKKTDLYFEARYISSSLKMHQEYSPFLYIFKALLQNRFTVCPVAVVRPDHCLHGKNIVLLFQGGGG
jgi:hypothetical protein